MSGISRTGHGRYGRTGAARPAAWTPVVAGVSVATGGCLHLLAAVSAVSVVFALSA
ncbi:hypothetical protein [Streptomyces sp. NBC_00872]|uniref:hypothetical protein n=1 Tax=Streptomyces sp. NBC_00872 TaxID=2903686 RepID=UPI0038699E7B|nr:hypothetical protein OG214_31135 [Streptomyces sp. NBC_00872]